MKLLKYFTLIIILWGIPSFFSYDEAIGSKFSFLMVGMLLLYYILNQKRRIIFPFILLGLLYFIISGLILVEGEIKFYFNDLIKYFVLIICGAELARDTSKKELFTILALGATSILAHALFFQGDFGRYSGFYLDPNGAGFICLLAYSLSFGINPKLLKILGQFIVTLAGVLTFSRTFLILWLLVSLIAVVSNRKNFLNFGLGFGVMIIVFAVSSFLKVDTLRINALENLFKNNASSSNQVLKEDSRFDTWAKYYDTIIDNPIFGNGYRSLGGIDGISQGVHNSYLMVLGEAGIFPFFIFIGIYIYMIIASIKVFKSESFKLMVASAIFIFLMTTHNYFDNFIPLFVSLWLFIKITDSSVSDLNTDTKNFDPNTIQPLTSKL